MRRDLNALLDYVQSIKPTGSQTVKVKETPTGSVLESANAAGIGRLDMVCTVNTGTYDTPVWTFQRCWVLATINAAHAEPEIGVCVNTGTEESPVWEWKKAQVMMTTPVAI